METSEPRTTTPASALTAASEPRTCEAHGEYTARSLTGRHWTRCPACEVEREAKRLAADAAGRATREQEALEARFRQSRIPARFDGKGFDDFVAQTDAQRNALDVAQAYAKSFPAMRENGCCLCLCGKAGTGKTHLAVSIAGEAMRAGYGALFTSVMGAIRSVKETYRKDSEETERDALRKLTSVQLLILDEVGVQFGSDTEKLILFEIINTRYEQVLPTIVISNLAKVGLEEYLGERAFDRLRENGGKLIVFDWDSHRKRAAA